MKPFMDEEFLLSTPSAQRLYHDFAEGLPIVDYHCHVSPEQIAKNESLVNITNAWLGGDHYKWRLMRTAGIDERFITGDAPDEEKFLRYAAIMPKAAGNPLYHWTHLELKRFFNFEEELNADTAPAVWALCNEKLQSSRMRVRGIIMDAGVYMIGTTDDPCDELPWHRSLQEDASFPVKVCPTFRPDKAVNIDKAGFTDYIAAFAPRARTLADVKQALLDAMDRFGRMGCRATDHGLDYLPFAPMTDSAAEEVFARAMNGEALTRVQADGYKTNLMLFMAAQIKKRGWVMQLHYNAQRNTNSRMFAALGADTGFDTMADHACGLALTGFLNAVEQGEGLPKTIVYSLNANDNAMIDSVIGAFQGGGVPGRVQHGSAWWFNDSLHGMRAQMTSLASMGMLGAFVGMLTDSRSFLSYTRHEYFRRILCDLLGGWMENGELYPDEKRVGELIMDICFLNAKRFFEV